MEDIELFFAQVPSQDEIVGINSVTTEEDKIEPWLEAPSRKKKETKITGPLPDQLEIVLENQVYLTKKLLPPALLNRVIRIAAFQNPEFYKAQAMRFPTYNKPRIINCCEDVPDDIGIPRGCIDKLISLLAFHDIKVRIKDAYSGDI